MIMVYWYYGLYHWFKNVYFHLSEDSKICFIEFCRMLFPFISTSSWIIATRITQLFVAIRYLLFFETFDRNFDLF